MNCLNNMNSSYQDKMQHEIKTAELVRIASMSTDELKKRIGKLEIVFYQFYRLLFFYP